MMMGFGFLWLLVLGGALVVVFLGGLGLLAGRNSNSQWPGGQRQPTAQQILHERFARGEISTEDHETVRAQLEH
jgi:uncharacterized membrane protein